MALRAKDNINHRAAVPAERCETCEHMGSKKGFYWCLLHSFNTSKTKLCDQYSSGDNMISGVIPVATISADGEQDEIEYNVFIANALRGVFVSRVDADRFYLQNK